MQTKTVAKFLARVVLYSAPLVLVWALSPSAGSGPDVSPKSEAKCDVVGIYKSLSAYKLEFGDYPTGSDSEIFKGLMGANPRGIVFCEPPADALDSEGRILDPWGKPYLIDIPSLGGKARVWSSGRNKRDENGAQSSDDISSDS